MGLLKKVAVGIGGVFGCVVLGAGGYTAWAFSVYESRVSFPDTELPDLHASTDPEVIARGRYLVNGPAHCSQCHSAGTPEHPELVGNSPLHGGYEFAMGPIATTYAANLTPDIETGIGRRTDPELARAIRYGVLADGSYSLFMASSVAKPADDDIVAILSYLRSEPAVRKEVPVGHWGPLGKLMIPMLTLLPADAKPVFAPPAEIPSVERGAYLARSLALCTSCHSKYDMSTFKPTGPEAGGGDPEASHGKDSDKEFVTPNLTSDPTGMTGKLTEDQFVRRMLAGRVYASSIMPWEGFQQMTESDLRSVYLFLHSLPPVQNDVGPTYRDVGWEPPR